MRSSNANKNMLAISANSAETGINEPQTLDTSLICGMENIITLDPRREANENESTGVEEATKIYARGATSSASLGFEKMMAQHAAMFLAYGLGNCTTVAQGNGYLHTIIPREDPVFENCDMHGLTAAQKLSGVAKRRFSSLFVDSVEINYVADSFAKLTTGLKGTGKFESNITKETISAPGNSTSLALAANQVEGATAEERLDSVHQVYVELTAGVRTEVAVTAVSDATPGVLTIDDPGGGAESVNYTVIYVPTEAAWTSFPANIEESPMEVCGLKVVMGGSWDGSSFVGGRDISSVVNEVSYSLQNNLAVTFAPGGCLNHANKCRRGGRSQVVKLNRDMRDYIMQLYLEENEYIGIELDLIGAEFAPGEHYQKKTVFPRLGVLNNPISVKDKLLAEAGDLQVLDGGVYPSVIHQIRNQVAGYAG